MEECLGLSIMFNMQIFIFREEIFNFSGDGIHVSDRNMNRYIKGVIAASNEALISARNFDQFLT